MSHGDDMNLKEQLRGVAVSVFDVLDRLSFIQAGFLLRAHLNDFVSGVFFLVDVTAKTDLNKLREAEDTDDVNDSFKPTVRRLCELSREVLFASDSSRLPPEFNDAIEKLFQFTVERIPECQDKDILDYRNNISQRNLEFWGVLANRS